MAGHAGTRRAAASLSSGGLMDFQKHFRASITCSVCLQERTPAPARVFVMVGEEEDDPAVMGFCYEHAAATVANLEGLARSAAGAKLARSAQANRNVIPLRPRA
jgi:hypothetical protein